MTSADRQAAPVSRREVLRAAASVAIGTPLFIAGKSIWQRSAATPLPEWLDGIVPSGLAILALSSLVWLLARTLTPSTRVSSEVGTIKRDKALVIFVASFGGDDSATAGHKRVLHAIRQGLRADLAEAVSIEFQNPLGAQLFEGDLVADAGAGAARTLLDRERGDLLVCGQLRQSDARAHLDLRFFSKETTDAHRLGFANSVTLNADFGPTVGAGLAAVVVAKAVLAQKQYDYVSQLVMPMADRLSDLLARDRRESVDHHDRARLCFWLGLIQSGIAHQTGQAERSVAAVKAFREALSIWTRELAPRDWALAQHNLGLALHWQGQHESGTKHLIEAIAAYEEALQVYTRDVEPAAWATTTNNIATALMRLGERESGGERLLQAVQKYREVMSEWSREQQPLLWATTQANLGAVLTEIGKRGIDGAPLREAVTAYREALTVFSLENGPIDWGATQHNLGVVWSTLGRRESGTESLQQAIAAFREALKGRTRDRVPLDWAMTQTTLGNALASLGGREDGTQRLEEAVLACRAALEEWTRDRVPNEWATAQSSLANALRSLGERERGNERLEEAVIACREALEEWTRDRSPFNWAMTQGNLGETLLVLGRRERGTKQLTQAVAAFEGALEVFSQEAAPHWRNQALSSLDRAKGLLASRPNG